MASTKVLSNKPILIYDADCGFCQKIINLYQRLNIRKRTICVPLQDKTILDKYQISFEKATTSIHFCTKDGNIYRGAKAFNAGLDQLIAAPVFSAIYHIPGIKWIQNTVYKYISANRYRLPGSTGKCTTIKLKKEHALDHHL